MFNCGDLSTAIRSSFAYPLYFSPVAIEDKIMFDGGIYNNFPSDVMLNDFEPDIIIGVNAGTGPELAGDDNILSQFKTMIMQSQVYALPGIDDIMISPELSNISVFDFNASKAAIDSGYAATMRVMDDIKEKIARRKPVDELNDQRLLFLQKYKPVLVDKINVLGVNSAKADYIKKILKNTNEPVRLKQLKPYYFKLIADENIRSIFPRLTYNEQTGFLRYGFIRKTRKAI
ncbi:MAG: patatin-like phospholipase family protein [Bacteroidetes bacterium]|nr:patatin-like phospholipase family protein [Bacteroidota bacterium]